MKGFSKMTKKNQLFFFFEKKILLDMQIEESHVIEVGIHMS